MSSTEKSAMLGSRDEQIYGNSKGIDLLTSYGSSKIEIRDMERRLNQFESEINRRSAEQQHENSASQHERPEDPRRHDDLSRQCSDAVRQLKEVSHRTRPQTVRAH